MEQKKPVVFACAGCSFAGQLAYQLALELDRRGIAEMSCLAGLGAEKPSFLRKIRGREVWIVDGCPIECSLGILDRIGKHADRHIRLHDYGIKKKQPPEEGVDLDRLIALVQEPPSMGTGATGSATRDQDGRSRQAV